MKPLALLLLLASPVFAASTGTAVAQSATPPLGSLDSSKIRLDAQDAAGALADAETALAHGGGADAFAARADAKRALGRSMDEVIADYAAAAELDPRYIEKYKGLIAQKESEEHPSAKSKSAPTGKGLNGLPIAEVLGAGAVGVLIILAGMILARGREKPKAPDDDEVKPGGKEDAAVEGHPKAADGEQPPKKEPPQPS